VFAAPQPVDTINHGANVSWNRRLHTALNLPEWIDLGVEHRSRVESLAHPFRAGEAERQTQYAHQSRLRLGIDPSPNLRFLGELQHSDASSVGSRNFSAGQIQKLDVLQLLATYTLPQLGGSTLRADLQGGRLSLNFGSRRLISRNGTRNNTNAFDGVHVRIGDEDGRWSTRTFFVQPVSILPDRFDDESSSKVRLWGAWLDGRPSDSLQYETYYFGLRDKTGDRDYHTGGVRIQRPSATGVFEYEIELMAKFGDRGDRDHSAFSGHAELGYSFESAWSPRLAFQLEYASGSDRSSGDSHTFDPLFGSRRFDLMTTATYGPFRRSNVISPGLRLMVSPRSDLRAHLKLRYWQLAQSRDSYSGSGLVDLTGR